MRDAKKRLRRTMMFLNAQKPGRHDDIFFDEYIQKILDWMNFAGKSVEE
jgi:hypothetical protein